MIGDDFNSRTEREEGRRVRREGEEEGERRTKDEKQNEEGKKMLNWLDETGMHVLNGNIEGDELEEFTYVGPQGYTVIDYVIVNEESEKT